jgi:hypothetical protein
MFKKYCEGGIQEMATCVSLSLILREKFSCSLVLRPWLVPSGGNADPSVKFIFILKWKEALSIFVQILY